MSTLFNESLKENVLNSCKDIAGSHLMVAACFYGPWACGYSDEESGINVLLILEGFPLLLGTYSKSVDGVNALVLTVDRRAFERDVEQGWLGEFVAEKVMFPYEPLFNGGFLRRQEVKTKRRIVSEILENIVMEFPESSGEFLIRVEYFVYEIMRRRAKLFPPIAYTFLNMLRKNLRRTNMESMMRGYVKALNELAEENRITFSDGYVKIARSYIDALRMRRSRFPLLLRTAQRAALVHILSVLSKTTSSLMQERRIFQKTHRKAKDEALVFQLEEPKKFLLMPTPLGTVALSDKSTIEDFVRKTIPEGRTSDVKIEEMGGVLNDVYLLTVTRDNRENKFVVKKFKDWSSFKWFPLALWSLGTRTFAVLARSRLEREYAVNEYLRSQGFPVPKILHISPQNRLIFEDFVEGEKLVGTIKRIISSKERASKETAMVKEVGRKIAEAHKLGVSLGDCKPENLIVTKEGKIFFLDLEQATRNGNRTWDLAEFLYYSGHYVSPISSAKAAEIIAKSFIEGYLEAGGSMETVRKAASARYVKVFSVFTPLHVIIAISRLCQKIGG